MSVRFTFAIAAAALLLGGCAHLGDETWFDDAAMAARAAVSEAPVPDSPVSQPSVSLKDGGSGGGAVSDDGYPVPMPPVIPVAQ